MLKYICFQIIKKTMFRLLKKRLYFLLILLVPLISVYVVLSEIYSEEIHTYVDKIDTGMGDTNAHSDSNEVSIGDSICDLINHQIVFSAIFPSNDSSISTYFHGLQEIDLGLIMPPPK